MFSVNPDCDDGQYREVDESTREAGEDFIVQSMLNRGSVSLIVLGNAHDVADNVRRLSPGTCDYLRVTTGDD